MHRDKTTTTPSTSNQQDGREHKRDHEIKRVKQMRVAGRASAVTLPRDFSACV